MPFWRTPYRPRSISTSRMSLIPRPLSTFRPDPPSPSPKPAGLPCELKEERTKKKVSLKGRRIGSKGEEEARGETYTALEEESGRFDDLHNIVRTVQLCRDVRDAARREDLVQRRRAAQSETWV